MKKVQLGFLIFTLLSSIYSSLTYAAFDNGYPTGDIEISPQGPVYMQTVKVEVIGQDDARPKVVWVQSDTDIWNASFDGGTAQTGTYSSGTGALPREKRTDFNLDMTPYAPDSLKDSLNNRFNRNYVKELMITDMDWKDAASYIGVGTKPVYQLGTTIANIKVSTGYPLTATNKWQFADRYDGAPKYMAEYYIPISVSFKGYVIEKKQIRVQSNATLAIGDTKDMTAEVRTLEYNMSNWNDNWYNVSSNSETTWSSSNTSVATVNSTGRVTAIANGSTTISAEWKKGPYWLKATAVITVGDEPGGGNTDPPDPGSVECTEPSPNRTMAGEDFNPVVSAEIRADSRGGERFDVGDRIPTSESLYGNVSSKTYLHNYEYQEMTGKCTYKVNVLVQPPPPDPNAPLPTPTPTPEPGGEGETEPEGNNVSVEVEKEYSFWTIKDVKVYKINEAKLWNYAFDGGGIRIQPTGYDEPYYYTELTSGYEPDPLPEDLQIPFDQDPQEAAENAVSVTVRNDTFTFYSQTLMSGSSSSNTGSTPLPISNAQPIDNNVLYSPGHVIPNSKTNKANQPSTGTIYYDQVNGSAALEYSINGINSVTVHTPVVNYAEVLDDDNRPFDQRMVTNRSIPVIILDREFTVKLDENGYHSDKLGYTQPFTKYTKAKRVRFPFGVFDGNQYIEENTWIYIDVGTAEKTFKMPTWIDENKYTIETEVIAINAGDGCQTEKNSDLTNHCAKRTMNVDVVGRLFGFRIWDIGDFRYEDVFRTQKGQAAHASFYYVSGGRDENRVNTKLWDQPQRMLPVRPGSHPTYAMNVPHNGYTYLFDFKTIGNVWNVGEGIGITPTFWFVPQKGGTAQQVNLYYDASGVSNKMIQVGSTVDKKMYSRVYKLADPFRNINTAELQRSAEYEYNFIWTPLERAKTPWVKFYQQYLTRQLQISDQGYNNEVLGYRSRTIIGPQPPTGSNVTQERAERSVQHWYGEYNLPVAPYILPTGTSVLDLAKQYGGALTGKEKEFMKNGYIIVNFKINTLREKNGNITQLLGYQGEIANMWEIEGQVKSSSDIYGNLFDYNWGDHILFESDYSVRNDYQGAGH